MRRFLIGAFVFLAASGASAGDAAYRRVLYLSAGGENQEIALERALNSGAVGLPYLVVVSRLGESVPASAIKRFDPQLVVSAGAKAQSVDAPVLKISAALDPASVEKSVHAIRERFKDAGTAARLPDEARAEALRRSAQEHLDLGDEEGAVMNLMDLSALVPGDLDALDRLVDIMNDGEPWLSLSCAERIIAAPGVAPARLAKILRQSGDARLRVGDFTGAERDFKRALTILPQDPDLPRLVAVAKRSRPDADSVAFAERAAHNEKGSVAGRAAAFTLAAAMRDDLGDRAGARTSVESALALAPDDLDALDLAVRLRIAQKSEALPYAERAERAAIAKPAWLRPSAERQSARLWLVLNEPSRAAAVLARALAQNPMDVTALGMLARIRGRLSTAELAGLRRFAPAAPVPAEPKPASEEAVKRALERDPSGLEALRDLVVFERDAKRPEAAVAAAARLWSAIPRAPLWQQAAADRELAELWFSLGDERRASLSLGRSLDVEADSIDAIRRLDSQRHSVAGLTPAYAYCAAAQYRLELGDPAGVEELVKLALAVEPKNEWALRLKARVGNIILK